MFSKILLVPFFLIGIILQPLCAQTISPDSAVADELIPIGYTTQKNSHLTGAIVSVKGELINRRPVIQVSQALQGLAGGILVDIYSGEPGNNDARMIIRGVGSLYDTSPLVLVDGFEMPINLLSPGDITSVVVLKDAASAAIYGAKAGNGVILITTKRGRAGKSRLEYKSYYSLTSPTVLPDLVWDNRDYFNAVKQAVENYGSSYTIPNEYLALPTTNYFDDFVSHGAIMGHDLTMTGGINNARYRWSTAYVNEHAYLSGDFYHKRLNSRFVLDLNIGKRLRGGISAALVFNNSRQGSRLQNSIPGQREPFENRGNSYYASLLTAKPFSESIDEQGRYGTTKLLNGIYASYNPAGIRDNEWLDKNTNALLSHAFLEYEPTKGLRLRYTLGLNLESDHFDETKLQFEEYHPFNAQTSVVNPGHSLRVWRATRRSRTDWLQSTYEKTIGKHAFSMLAGFRLVQASENYVAASEYDFIHPSVVSPGNGQITSVNGNLSSSELSNTLLGHVSYAFDGKYLIDFNFARDYLPGRPSLSFLGISGGYIISEESFWKSNFVDFLKIRASWGSTGFLQDDALPGFLLPVGTGPVPGIDNYPHDRTRMTDLGVDAVAWAGRVSVTVDYFEKQTDHVPSYARIYQIQNGPSIFPWFPSIQNKGGELGLNVQHEFGEWTISTGFNLSYQQNKVEHIYPAFEAEYDFHRLNATDNSWAIRGEPVQAVYGYAYGGIYQTDDFNGDGSLKSGVQYEWQLLPQPGDIKYVDQNGDHVIDEQDKVVIGNRNPAWIYGFHWNVTYKGFDFSGFIQGIGKADMYLPSYTGVFDQGGLRSHYLNAWTAEKPNTEIPRLWLYGLDWNATTAEKPRENGFWVQNRAYTRLKNLVMGYSLTESALEKVTLRALRIFVSGQNIWTRTRLIDLDPEQATTDQRVNASLPQIKSWTAGLDLSF